MELFASQAGTPVSEPMSLGRLASLQDIDLLSIRQLKEILVNSFVNYKGCCERQELVEHVRRLWLEHRRNQKYGSRLCSKVIVMLNLL